MLGDLESLLWVDLEVEVGGRVGGRKWVVRLEMSPQDCRSVVDFREAHWWVVRGPGCSRYSEGGQQFWCGLKWVRKP